MKYYRSTIGLSRYEHFTVLQILIRLSFQYKDSIYLYLTPVLYQVELISELIPLVGESSENK